MKPRLDAILFQSERPSTLPAQCARAEPEAKQTLKHLLSTGSERMLGLNRKLLQHDMQLAFTGRTPMLKVVTSRRPAKVIHPSHVPSTHATKETTSAVARVAGLLQLLGQCARHLMVDGSAEVIAIS